jgi:hypothetical protein
VAGLAVLAGACDGPRRTTPFDGEAAYRYVEEQVAFGPRVPNTGGHRRAGDWILAHLRRTADTVEVRAFRHVTAGGDTLALRNFVARFRPERGDRVLFVVHWDTRPVADRAANLADQRRPVPGANDGASGVAVLLGVADVLAAAPPSVGVDLLFVDGEDYGDWSARRDVLLGARRYAAELSPADHPLFAVVWDMVGDADLQIHQEGYSLQAAPEVVRRVWETAHDLGYDDTFVPRVRHTVTDDHVPLIEAGVRAIDVIDFDYPWWHTPEDTPDKVSAESLKIVGDVAVALVM